MDISSISIALFTILTIVILAIFMLKSVNKKTFKADDGSVFEKETDLDVYQSLYEKTKPFFSCEEDIGSSQLILGFQKVFLSKLTKEGFPDLKTLVKYRSQFKSLSDLLNT